ncbi:MAG TPA: hypothetical protein VLA19_19720 [Herpetosiphonaceae bacterium]|nr:hypothetical protein [Herpetosiphonaceae bacterium]
MNKLDETAPVRVIRAAGTLQIAKAVQEATVAATTGHCHLVAGLLPHSHAPPRREGGWEFSLSHWGRPPVVVSMHRYKRDAEAQVVRVYRASGARDLRDDDAFAALVTTLAAFGDGEVG